MNTKVKYQAKGQVLGNLWMGGKAYYNSRTLVADTIEELENKIFEGIKSGSLDSGAGFDGLVCAELTIIKHITKTIDKKEYKREEIYAEIRYNTDGTKESGYFTWDEYNSKIFVSDEEVKV